MKVINTYIVRYTNNYVDIATLLYETENNVWFLNKVNINSPLTEISQYEAQSLILDSGNYISSFSY